MLRLLAPGEAQELQADIRQILRAGGEGSVAATQLALVEPTLLRERERERERALLGTISITGWSRARPADE